MDNVKLTCLKEFAKSLSENANRILENVENVNDLTDLLSIEVSLEAMERSAKEAHKCCQKAIIRCQNDMLP